MQEEHPEDANEHLKPSMLTKLPLALQTVLLLQCMYQALILTMLGRDAILDIGVLGGLAAILLMLLPTTIMSLRVTPLVLRNFSIAYSVTHVRADVLDDMRAEFQQEGDYAAAASMLEVLANAKLTEDDLRDEELVRARVRDLTKLGEMKWRYRVVEEGHSPRDDAITVLTEAKSLIERHVALSGEGALAEKSEKGVKSEKNSGRPGSPGHHHGASSDWSAEMSEVCQGLALTRLIFNTDRSEDGEIEALLNEAQALRQKANLRAALADTMNALGSLKQKQRAFKDAEHYYSEGLRIRYSLPEGSDHGKSKEQCIAQSLVSLGNLYTQLAEAEPANTEEGRERRMKAFDRALTQLRRAKQAYIKGFNETHPKVAWGLEGIGNVHQKMGNLRLAQEAWAEAVRAARSAERGPLLPHPPTPHERSSGRGLRCTLATAPHVAPAVHVRRSHARARVCGCADCNPQEPPGQG